MVIRCGKIPVKDHNLRVKAECDIPKGQSKVSAKPRGDGLRIGIREGRGGKNIRDVELRNAEMVHNGVRMLRDRPGDIGAQLFGAGKSLKAAVVAAATGNGAVRVEHHVSNFPDEGVDAVENPVMVDEAGTDAAPRGKHGKHALVLIFRVVQNGAANDLGNVFYQNRCAWGKIRLQELRHRNIAAPAGGERVEFQCVRVVIHNAGGGDADAAQLCRINGVVRKQAPGKLTDGLHGGIGRRGQRHFYLQLIDTLGLEIQQRQPDGIWPETDAEQIFFGGKGKKLGALAAGIGGVCFAGGDNQALLHEKLDGLCDGLPADACLLGDLVDGECAAAFEDI